MSAQTTPADALELLIADHREVDQLFELMVTARASNDVEGQRYVFDHVVHDLSVHAVIEEEILYPAMRKALPDGDQQVEHALEEHQQAKELLTRIDGKSPDDTDAQSAFDELVIAIREHVEEEEGELFAQMRSACSQDDLVDMGVKLEKARKAAPTHPHPHAPNTPPGNMIAGGVAMVLDKIRDAVRK